MRDRHKKVDKFQFDEDEDIGEKVEEAEFITTALEMGLSLEYDRMKSGE